MNVTELVRPVFAAACIAVALLPACGGGGDAAQAGGAAARAHAMNGVGSGGTGKVKSYAAGPIAGFGSIVVNGVHYDDGTATIVDDDGLPRTTADLKLGGAVTLDAGPITAGAAVASHIVIGSDIVGTVERAWDPATGLLQVMGQPVAVTAGTVLDAWPGGAAAIMPGALVEVSSLYDPASGVYAATRIDPRLPTLAFKTRGAVAALDTRAKTFRVGSQAFAYGAVANPPRLKNGQLACVDVQLVRNAAGQWVVTTFLNAAAAPADGMHAEVDGSASAVTDPAHFTVAGLAVDATHATVAPPGTVVVAGMRVSVKGTMAAGVLVASGVDREDDDFQGGQGRGGEDDNGGRGGHGAHGQITLAGPLLGAPDDANRRFVLRGPTTVDYAGAAFVGGGAADLAAGRRVQVSGRLSADGTSVVASEVRF
jgi:hypothetical protein